MKIIYTIHSNADILDFGNEILGSIKEVITDLDNEDRDVLWAKGTGFTIYINKTVGQRYVVSVYAANDDCIDILKYLHNYAQQADAPEPLTRPGDP